MTARDVALFHSVPMAAAIAQQYDDVMAIR
ncbi:hypothetical protein ACVWZK_007847 [Bradyrhizobium sp. GM0.4]|jgi:hypothetical protein